MFWSKSFGYALRGILYVATNGQENRRIRVDEIAPALDVPQPFLSKIMKKMVKHGMLKSTKGPHGGFSLSEKTLSTNLYDLLMLTDSDTPFDSCVLRLKECNARQPCALHHKMKAYREDLLKLFTNTTIRDLLNADNQGQIRSMLANVKSK
jgi:Rrf2 family transcriptional regulator, iron-sulfur cluster assembly transcription factor